MSLQIHDTKFNCNASSLLGGQLFPAHKHLWYPTLSILDRCYLSRQPRVAGGVAIRNTKCQCLGKRTFIYPHFITKISRNGSAEKTPNFENRCACMSACVSGNLIRPRDTWKGVSMKGNYGHEWGKNTNPQKNFPLHRI